HHLARLQAEILVWRGIAVHGLQDGPSGAAEPPLCAVEQPDADCNEEGKEPDIAHPQIAPVVAQTSQVELARGALDLGHLANVPQASLDRDVRVCSKIQLAWRSTKGAGAIRPR